MLNPSLIFLIHQKLSVMSPNSTLSLSRDVNLWVQNRCFDILPFTHLQTFSLLVLNLKTQKHLHFAQSQSHRIFDLEIARLESSSIFLRRLSLPFACSFDTSAVRRVVDWSVWLRLQGVHTHYSNLLLFFLFVLHSLILRPFDVWSTGRCECVTLFYFNFSPCFIYVSVLVSFFFVLFSPCYV